ncbi:MAG: hypothetical protein SR3Q1_00275 [Quinella sp. 3Q1]|nr:hypothetical protein [Quinella sp. 3Q1]MBR6889051.1 hypothetical protein [Selenomonadaceae bacterium]
MATREENLKKINEELEKLDDEELDKVAGGVIPIFASYNIIEPNDTQNQPPQSYRVFK